MARKISLSNKLFVSLFIILMLLAMCANIAVHAEDTPSPTEAPKPQGVIVTAYVLYELEEIEINSTQPVYWAPLKKEADTAVKVTELIPAARKDTFDLYYVDISTLAPGKAAYIGLTANPTPDSSGMVEVSKVVVKPYQKKVDFNIDYAAEAKRAQGRDVIYSVVITDNDNKVVTYDHSGRNNEEVKEIKNLIIQWRKGNNLAWRDIDELSKVEWEIMRASGAVLYLRVGAINQTGQKEGQRFSKETKIKLAVSKAPAAKIDVTKLTVSLKNGMQFRKAGSDDTAWKTILPFNAGSKTEGAIRTSSAVGDFDPFTENTKAKATFVTIPEIYGAIGEKEPKGDEVFSLEYRIAATAKKPASRVGTLKIPAQTPEPTAVLTVADGVLKIGAVSKHNDDKTENATFEYMFVLKEDLDQNWYDMTNTKWVAVKAGAPIKDNARSAYVLKNGTKRSVGFTDAGAVLLLRRKGIAGGGKKADVIASKYAVLEIPAIATPTPSSTPTPTPTTN